MGAAEGETTLNVYGEQSGEIISVLVETHYIVWDIQLQFLSHIYTENAKDKITTGAVTTEYAEFTESLYHTANNKTLHVIEQTALKSGYMGMDEYLAENGVLYQLHISYLANDAEQAKE